MELNIVSILVSCIFGIIVVRASEETEWGYEESNGPNTWGENYKLCNGKSQSPINITSNNAVLNKDLREFSRNLFDVPPISMLIKNTGHSLQVDVTGGYTIDNRDLLPAKFQAVQFHLHWAKAGAKGSEHQLNGKQYFGELHIVHYNTKYDNVGAAAPESDGLAVLGFFIEDDYPQDNLEFNRMLDLVSKVNRTDESEMYESTFSIETILPPDFDVYYRYKGSLTTPACYESVVWTVFETPIKISRSQAKILETKVFVTEGSPLNGNFRPPQPLNGRNVEKSPPCVRGTASIVNVSFTTLFAALIVSLLHAQYS